MNLNFVAAQRFLRCFEVIENTLCILASEDATSLAKSLLYEI